MRAPTCTQRDAARARIILRAPTAAARQIAERLGIPIRRVERWRGRFLRKRLKGLGDLPRRDHALTFSSVTRCEIIALACDPVRQEAMCRADQSARAPLPLEFYWLSTPSGGDART